MYICKTSDWNCANCDQRIPDTEVVYDGEFYWCSYCGDGVDQPREIEPSFVCVAAYDTWREFGGPEEGGWYYDAGSRVSRTVRCFDRGDMPQARLYHAQLSSQYGCVRAYGNRLAPPEFPTSRPRYS